MDQGQVIESNSSAIYDGWSCDLSDFPSTEVALISAVREDLRKALPSRKNWVAGPDKSVPDVIMEESMASKTNLSPELESLRGIILSLTYLGDTEDATHFAIDALILRPIKDLCLRNGCTLTTNRNGVDSSGATLKSLRPDVLFWLPSGVLALKGEDKAFGVDMTRARDDLRRKANVFSDAFFGQSLVIRGLIFQNA